MEGVYIPKHRGIPE